MIYFVHRIYGVLYVSLIFLHHVTADIMLLGAIYMIIQFKLKNYLFAHILLYLIVILIIISLSNRSTDEKNIMKVGNGQWVYNIYYLLS